MLEKLQGRYGRDKVARQGDYDRLAHQPGQSYLEYADAFAAAAYGLEEPRIAQLRKYLFTMRDSNNLRKFFLINLPKYEDVQALAREVEVLTQGDEQRGREAPVCRTCGRAGHIARNCPRRPGQARRGGVAGAAPQRLAQANNQAEAAPDLLEAGQVD